MGSEILYIRDERGEFIPADGEAVVAAAKAHLSRRVRRGATLSSPGSVREYLAVKLGALDYEVFGLILVDARHRVLEYVELFRGTIDGASVHPREVVKLVIEKGASAVVAVHNHPSGVKDQSRADEAITRRIKDCLALIDVRLLDHLVVAGPEVLSFAESGLL